MAFNEWTHPDFFAGIRVAGKELTDHTKLITGAAVNQQDFAGFGVFGHGWRTGHGVTGGVITKFLVPDHFTGVFIQRNNPCIERTKVYFIAEDRYATVHYVTAWTDIVRQAVAVVPQAFTGFGIQGPNP